jgi:hypothetical protein
MEETGGDCNSGVLGNGDQGGSSSREGDDTCVRRILPDGGICSQMREGLGEERSSFLGG